jgi:hypothetical protein
VVCRIANIRGSLHAVADFSVFCGGAPTPQNNNTRLLLVGSKHGANAALLVTSMLGLKNPEDFVAAGDDPEAPVGVQYVIRTARGLSGANSRCATCSPITIS